MHRAMTSAQQRGRLSRRPVALRKQSEDYYGGIITGELIRRNYHVPSLGAYSAPKVLILGSWVARRATAQGVGI